MNCTNCSHPLIPGARFCGKCGTLAPASNSQPTGSDPDVKVPARDAARRISVLSHSDDETADEPVLGVPMVHKSRIIGPIGHPDSAAVTPAKPLTPKPMPELAAPKPHKLLEGPHPALAKAQQQQQQQKQPQPAVADTPPQPALDDDEFENVTVTEPPRHVGPPPPPRLPLREDDMPREDIPGPRHPFGHQMSDKSYLTAFLLSFFLGVFGFDRFYTGQYVYGFFKLLTFGGGFILWYLDTILLLANVRRDRFSRRLWGRKKDFRTSLYIFIGFTLLGVGLMVAAYMFAPSDLEF